MATALRALTRAMEVGNNATEVLARLAEQGFVVVNQEAVITQAGVVLSCHDGITQPEVVARTVIMSAIMGAQLEGMLEDG